MTGAIFVGSTSVFGITNHILYIYDPDGDLTTEEAGRRIIQGFAGDADYILPLAGSVKDLDINETDSLFGDLVIESTVLSTSVQLDALIEDWNITEANLNGADASTVILSMDAAVQSLGSATVLTVDGVDRTFYNTLTPYNPFFNNSNTGGGSVARLSDFDLVNNTPNVEGDTGNPEIALSTFVGIRNVITTTEEDVVVLDGDLSLNVIDRDGNDTYTIKEGTRVTFSRAPGDIGDNTVILEGYGPGDVQYERVGNILLIKDATTGDTIVSAYNQFSIFGNPTEGITTLKFKVNGTINEANNKDLTALTSEDLASVFDSLASWYSSTRSYFGTTVFSSWDPLVIDLDGDGVETLSSTSGTYFDLDGNDFAEATGWVHQNDGLLVYDQNSDGEILASELFGDATTDGFTELSTHDSNGDGVISSSDTIFSNLKIWQDLNRDGYAQSDELSTLADRDIASISLSASTVSQSATGGTITHTSTITYENQTTATIANVAFTRDTTNTRYVGDFDLDLETMSLPDLRGYNAMATLRTATSLDNSGTGNLKDIIVGIANNNITDIFANYSTIQSDIIDALYRWGGVDATSPTSRGAYVDAQKLGFIEAYLGSAFVDANFPDTNPGAVQAREIHDLFDDILVRLTGNILVQTMASFIYDVLPSYNVTTDAITGATDLSADILAVLEDYATNDLTTTAARQAFWLGVADFLRGVHLSISNGDGFGLSTADEAAINTAIENSDSSLTWYTEDHNPTGGVTSIEYKVYNPIGDTFTGTSGNNNLSGGANDDVMIGLGGADELLGSSGNDIIYGHNEDGSGDDGAADFLSGDAGSDLIYGGSGNDTLRGGTENDHLIGGAGNDILMEQYTNVAGQSLMEDSAGDDDYRLAPSSSPVSDVFIQDTAGTDNLRFTSSTLSVASITTANETKFTISDLTFTRYINDSLRIDGNNGTTKFDVVLIDQLTDLQNAAGIGIEYLMLYQHNGSSSPRQTLDLKNHILNWSGPMATIGSPGDDIIYGITFGSEDDDIDSKGGDDTVYGDDGDDEIDGNTGNDTLYGGTGTDDIVGNSGNDILYGDAGDDTLNGGDGSDSLYGGADNDTLIGGSGNDVLEGGGGNDSLSGNTGDDIYIYSSGNDTVQDTSNGGTDYVYLPVNVTPENLAFSNTGTSNVTADITGSLTGQIVFVGQRGDASSVINYIQYDDGFVQYFDNYLGWKWDTTFSPTSDETLNGANGITYETFIGRGGVDRIYGGDNFDSISGGADNDFLYGEAGTDHLHGGSGNDELYGGTGTDSLWGGAGDDLLAGGSGIDLLNGGAGTDTADYSAAAAAATVSLTSGTANNDGDSASDTLIGIENLSGSAYNDTLTGDATANVIEGRAGNDTLDGAGGIDTASYANAASAVTVSLANGSAQNTVGAGTDTLSNFENLTGSAYNDTLTGNSSANLITGGIGADTIAGGSGNDTLYGGNDNDTIEGEAGDDTMDGGSGADTVTYANAGSAITVSLATISAQDTMGAGIDTLAGFENLTGSAYSDTLTGDGVANLITGGMGNDTLDGAGDNDTLNGGTGDDALTGGSGNDTLNGDNDNDIIKGGGGDDILNGGADTDTADYSAAAAAATVNLLNGEATVDGDGGEDILTSIENITGSAYADDLTGDSSVNTISGGAGNDTISGGAGNDTLSGENDDDTLEGGVGDDTLDGGAGLDTLTYANAAGAVTASLATGTATGDGTDTVSNFENVTGSAYNDMLTGSAAANLLSGGNGNDTLAGGSGNDTLDGGSGTDTTDYSGAAGAVVVNLGSGTATNDGDGGSDTLTSIENVTGSANNDSITGDGNTNEIQGGGGNDILDGGAGTDTVSYANASSAVTVSLATTIGQNTVGAGTDTISNFENLTGSAYNDTLTGDSNANSINGGDGNDTIKGGAGNDSLDGGIGTDTISFAGAAAVTVSLASGIATGDGTDMLSNFENVTGSSDNDTIAGDSSANTLDGGAGNDTLIGGAGNDALTGGGGTDTVDYSGSTAGVVVNLFTGSASSDGLGGADTITGVENVLGSAYADSITGDNNGNVLDGGAGDDIIEGRNGNDTLIGGAGTDTVTFANASGVTIDLTLTTAQNTGAGTDTISGFESVIGSNSADTITGDSNDNVLDGGGSGDLIYGGTGNDSLYGGAGDDTLVGGSGNDILDGGSHSTGGGAKDTADYSAAASGIVVNLSTGVASNDGDGGSDTLSGIESVIGSAYNDTITGDNNNNTLTGGNGDDTIEGGAATDTLSGGSGIDLLTYANATSAITISLSTATQQNTGGAGTDTVSGFENLTGSAYNDTLTGDSNTNVINGGAGNDTIKGAGGNDTLDGESGTDTLSYSAAAAGVTASLSMGTASNDGDGGSDTFSNFENLTGSSYADTLTGDSTANVVTGGAGNDTLDGGGDNDTLNGGDDNDTLTGGAGNDTVNGDNGNDTLIAGIGNDTLTGGSGTDIVDYSAAASGVTVNLSTGSASNDGDGGTDTLSGIESVIGSSYADTITSYSSASVINSGGGDDTINLTSGSFASGDSLIGGSGTDAIVLGSGAWSVDFTVGTLEDVETLTGGSGGNTVTILATYFGGMFTSIDLAGAGDVLNIVAVGDISAATAATIDNTETGNLIGTSGTDTITLTGSQLDAIIIGSGTINLGSGSGDTINLTSTSSDLNTLGTTDASIQGVEGVSASSAGSAVTITLSGQTEAFTLTGSSSADTITAGSGADTVTGGSGNDTITGGSGNDVLYGSGGNDILYGGANDDLIYGQDGDDSLTGDGGADTFVFEAATAFNNVDDIQDFSTGQSDKLDISDILDGHYTFGTDDITQFVQITDNGTDSTLAVDQNGGGDNFVSVAMILGVTGLTNEASLETSGALITH